MIHDDSQDFCAANLCGQHNKFNFVAFQMSQELQPVFGKELLDCMICAWKSCLTTRAARLYAIKAAEPARRRKLVIDWVHDLAMNIKEY